MTSILSKPTFFLVVCLLFILIGTPISLYYLFQSNTGVFFSSLILLGVFMASIILLCDRILVNRIGNLKLSFVELILSICFIVIYSYWNRGLYVEINNEKLNFLVIVQNPGDLENDRFEYVFPFGKRIISDQKVMVVEKILPNLKVTPPKSWGNSYSTITKSYGKFENVLFCSRVDINPDSIVSESYILNLIKK